MDGLLPIIRRARRPLLPIDEAAAPRAVVSVPVATVPVVAETVPIPVAPVIVSPPPASKKKGHAPRATQTAAAS